MLISHAAQAQELRDIIHGGDRSSISNSMAFKSGAKLYVDNSRIEGAFSETAIANSPYMNYLMVSPNAVIDGWQQGPVMRTWIQNNNTGYNVFTGAGAAAYNSLGSASADSVGILLDSIPIERFVFVNSSGAPPGGPGGPAGPQPLPFLVGPGWHPYRFNNERNDALLELGQQEGVRPPQQHGFRRHGAYQRRATIRIMTVDGRCWFATTNMMLLSVNKACQETVQTLKSFDGDMLLFGPSAHRVFTIVGGLINALDYDWSREWKYNWDNYLRGSVTLENDARFFMLYDGWLLGGHLINYSESESSSSPYLAMLNFGIFVTDYVPLPDMTIMSAEDPGSIGGFNALGIERWISKESFVAGANLASAGTQYRDPGLSLDEATAKYRTPPEQIESSDTPQAEPPEDVTPEDVE